MSLERDCAQFPTCEEPQNDQNETSHTGRDPAKHLLGKAGPLGPRPVSGFQHCRVLLPPTGTEPYYTDPPLCRVCAGAVCISLVDLII